MSSHSEDAPLNSEEEFSTEDIYNFYRNELFPSIAASLPILLKRIGDDFYGLIEPAWDRTRTFLIPWSHKDSLSLTSLWNQTVLGKKTSKFSTYSISSG